MIPRVLAALLLTINGLACLVEALLGAVDRLAKLAAVIIGKRLFDLLLGVHDKRPVRDDGLAQGHAGDQEKAPTLVVARLGQEVFPRAELEKFALGRLDLNNIQSRARC